MRFVPIEDAAEQPTTTGPKFVPLEESTGPKFVPIEEATAPAPIVKASAPVVAPTPTSAPLADLGSPMGESLGTEITNVAQPKPVSVLQGKQLPPTAPTEDKFVLNPKFTNSIEAQLNALPEEERQAALDNLAKRTDAYGRAAKLIQQRYKNYDALKTDTEKKTFDPRLEAQTKRFMDKGYSAETAEGEAERQARRGQIGPGLAEAKETPQSVIEGEKYKLPDNATPIEQTINALQRGGKQALIGSEQAVRGTHLFLGDMLGLDMSNTKNRLDALNENLQGMGENKYKPLQIVEGAISSIAQQLPYLLAGVATGSEAAVLMPMFSNSFGQNYEEARRNGLSVEDSTIRSTLNAAFEVLGEKAGLGSEMKAIRASTKGMPTSDLVAYYTKALAREIPGEEFTYAGQSAVDKVLGLNPDMDFKGFLKGAVDTMLATVAQGGAMTMGGAAINKAVQKATSAAAPATPEQQLSAQDIAEQKGFLVPTPKKEEAAPPAPAPNYGVQNATYQKGYGETNINAPAAAPTTPTDLGPIGEVRPSEELKPTTTTETPAPAPAVDQATQIKQLTEEHVKSGIPEEDAQVLAEREVKGTENAGQPVSTPSGVSTTTPSEPSAGGAPTGAGAPAGNGVVSTEPNAGQPVAGEEAKPATVDQETGEITPTETKEQPKTPEETQKALTTGEPSGPSTLETVQAKPQEQKTKSAAGRPAAPAEVKDKKAAAAKETRAATDKANYTVKKALPLLDQLAQPVDTSEAADEDAAKEMVAAHAAKKRAIVRELLMHFNNPKIRGTEAWKRVKSALAHPSITEKEKSDIDAGLKIAQKPLKQSSSPVGKADRSFSRVPNAAQALARIMKTGTIFEKLIAGRIRGFVNGVKIHVIEVGQELPEELQQHIQDFDAARGLYMPDTNTVYLKGDSYGNDHGINNITVLHELLHAATNQKIVLGLNALHKGLSDAKLTGFVRDLTNLGMRASKIYDALDRRGLVSKELKQVVESTLEFHDDGTPYYKIFDEPQEFLAYGLTDPTFQNFLEIIPSTRAEKSAFGEFVRKILNLFNIGKDNYSALHDLVDVTDKILDAKKTPLMRLVEYGMPPLKSALPTQQNAADEAKRDAQQFEAQTKIYDRSNTGAEILKANQTIQIIKNPSKALGAFKYGFKDMTYANKDFILNFPTTDFVAEVSGIQSLKDANMHLERMGGMQKQMMSDVSNLIESIEGDLGDDDALKNQWTQFTFAVQGINPETTGAQNVKNAWNALGAKGQSAFKKITKYYARMFDYMGLILEQNLQALGGDSSETSHVLDQVRATINSQNRIDSYVPLLRDQNGQFWVAEKSGGFWTAKTQADRRKLLEFFAKEKNKTVDQLIKDGDVRQGNDLASLRKDTLETSPLLQRIFTLIDKSSFNTGDPIRNKSYQEAIKEDIFQMWLHLQPENSIRKNFINRKTIPGYNVDLLQGLAIQGSKFSLQIPRLKYGRAARLAVSAARANTKDQLELTPYVKQMDQRVTNAMTPEKEGKISTVARFFTNLSSIYYLSQATAITNVLSAYEVGLPQLSKKNSPAAAAAELGRSMKVFGLTGVRNKDGGWTMPTILNTVQENEDDAPDVANRKKEERMALNQMVNLGVSENTAIRNLFHRAETPSDSDLDKALRTAKTIGTLATFDIIHASERISREMIYYSSFRLGREKLLNGLKNSPRYKALKTDEERHAAEHQFVKDHMDDLVAQAAKDVRQSLFNYNPANRPAFLKSTGGRLMFQFAVYKLNILQFQLRNLIGMVKPLDDSTRAEAMRAFFGSMFTSWTLGGVTNMAGGSLLIGFLSALYNRERDKLPADMRQLEGFEWYKHNWLKNLADVRIGNSDLGSIVRDGPVNAFSGLDIGSHTNMSDIFFNPSSVVEGRTMRDQIVNYLTAILPPVPSMVQSMAQGLQHLSDGEYLKGIEKLYPAASMRHLLQAYRYSTQGETTKYNQTIMTPPGATRTDKDFRRGEILGQAIGLRPMRLEELQDANRMWYQLDKERESERSKVITSMTDALVKNNKANIQKAAKQMGEFNKKYSATYPDSAITIDSIDASYKSKMDALGLNWRGAQLNEKNMPMAGQVLGPSHRVSPNP